MKPINLLLCICIVTNLYAITGNKKAGNFNGVTKNLLTTIYNKIPKETIYCNAKFDIKKHIINHNGFSSDGNEKLNNTIEWEHIVPASLFGKRFSSWNIGDEKCVSVPLLKILDNRSCAIKSNSKFRRIYTDLYNIYPAIGQINRKRKDYQFIDGDASISNITKISSLFFDKKTKRAFGSCEFIIHNKKVIPSNKSKGIIARTYLYMSSTYKRECKIKLKQKQLFEKWSKKYPVTKNECHRAKLIEKIQGNKNKIVYNLCKKANLYK